jgi:hypothetical protein
LLQDFSEQRPQCEVHIAFTSVYQRHYEAHNAALRKLNDLWNVKLLDIFTVKEWRLLQNKGFLSLSPLALRQMEMWDCYWREELKKIITISPETYERAEAQMVGCHYSIVI